MIFIPLLGICQKEGLGDVTYPYPHSSERLLAHAQDEGGCGLSSVQEDILMATTPVRRNRGDTVKHARQGHIPQGPTWRLLEQATEGLGGDLEGHGGWDSTELGRASVWGEGSFWHWMVMRLHCECIFHLCEAGPHIARTAFELPIIRE